MSSLMWASKWDDTNKASMWNYSHGPSSDINVDVSKVWSSKSEFNDDSDISNIQSIWSTTNEQFNETASVINTENHVTPTNSPSVKRNEIISKNERWGVTKINQTTPWEVGDLEDEHEKRTSDPMVWRAKIDGTEVWEEYYAHQHGKRRPQNDNFSSDLWSNTSDMGNNSPIWGNKNMDMAMSNGDIFNSSLNMSNVQNNFNGSNNMRPNMTRQQAQKYLIEMGYSLSDAIGALVRNQMDLSKAIIDLQNRYRTKPNNTFNAQSNFPYGATVNGMTDLNGNNSMNRMTPSMITCQNSTSGFPLSNFNSGTGGGIDMFQENNDQFLDNRNFDPMTNSNSNVSANRMPIIGSGLNMAQSGLNHTPHNLAQDNMNLFRGPNSIIHPTASTTTPQARPITANNNSMGSSHNSNFNSNQDPSNVAAVAAMSYLGQSMNRLNISNQSGNGPPQPQQQQQQQQPHQMNNNMRLSNTSQTPNSANYFSKTTNNSFMGQPQNQFVRSQSHQVPTSFQPGSHVGNTSMPQYNTNNAGYKQGHLVGQHQMQPQQMFHRNNSMINWHSNDLLSNNNLPSSNNSNNNLSMNGAISDLNNNNPNGVINSQNRLAKNIYPNGLTIDNSKMCGIIVRQVQQNYVDYIKAICAETGSLVNFHLVGQTQSMLLHISNAADAYRCIEQIHKKLHNVRADFINSQEEYYNYLSGAN